MAAKYVMSGFGDNSMNRAHESEMDALSYHDESRADLRAELDARSRTIDKLFGEDAVDVAREPLAEYGRNESLETLVNDEENFAIEGKVNDTVREPLAEYGRNEDLAILVNDENVAIGDRLRGIDAKDARFFDFASGYNQSIVPDDGFGTNDAKVNIPVASSAFDFE